MSSAARRATFLNSGCSLEIQERMISLCETSVSHKPQRKPRCPNTLGSSCDVENVNKGLILVFFLAKARANFLVFAETLQPMTPLISSRFERDTPISVRLTDSSSYHSYTTFTPINACLMFSAANSKALFQMDSRSFSGRTTAILTSFKPDVSSSKGDFSHDRRVLMQSRRTNMLL